MSDAEPAAATLLVFVDEAAALGPWLQLASGAVAARGGAAEPWPSAPGRTVLAVPGEQVALHWVELSDGLTAAQAAAAARLLLAGASAEPLTGMHVAVGRAEQGLTPVALVANSLMAAWLAAAAAAELDPAAIIPGPLLLVPPDIGFARRDRGEIADYRARAAAFALEPGLATALIGDAPVTPVDTAAFEAALGPIVAAPPLDLRQGGFAPRRQWRMSERRLRRIGTLALVLALLTLAVQMAMILGYTFAADRARAEAEALAGQSVVASGPGFGGTAAALFAAVQATPNVELSRLEYRADGSLDATLLLDSPATFTALQQRLEGSGLNVRPGERRNAGGRPTVDVTLRAS